MAASFFLPLRPYAPRLRSGYNLIMATIKVLPPETSRLIAAGEVIDRPAAVLREFLDNAIDSGATEVSVEVAGGGIDLVRVTDNGCGMSREDLELSILPHATSKISVADDLLALRTLGFRGEALASVAAAARLEIVTSEGETTWRLTAAPGQATAVSPVAGRKGTRVEASRLFENYPARKQFLKRAQAEGLLCRQVFEDKALAHPSVSMRYQAEGRLGPVLLPSSPEERVAAIHDELPRDLVHRVRFSGPGCEGSVVIASPAFYRTDRRLMQAFVNRRRVADAGLLQALDWAFQGFLPGGAHPAAFLFADVDPALADFNIHPAKREVRFKDFQGLRSAFTRAVQAFLLELSRREPSQVSAPGWKSLEFGEDSTPAAFAPPNARAGIGGQGGGYANRFSGGVGGPSSAWDDFADLRERVAESDARNGGASGPAAAGQDGAGGRGSPAAGPRYVGRALGLFLVAEADNALYLIDQHAAHERHLYDRYLEKPPVSQELLVPAVFEAEDEAEERRLEESKDALRDLGFGIEREGASWVVSALPAPLDRDPVGSVREVLGLMAGGSGREGAGAARTSGARASGAREALLATAACRAAVKDGDELDEAAAADLVRIALALPEPRCPHGRPVWVRITREELFALVRRTV